MAESSAHIRPMRWLAHLPLAILPFLAAAVTEAPRLGRDLDARINAALAQAGQGWAKPALSGRDVEVRGMAPDRAAAAAARAAVEATEGVRRVEMRIGVGAP